MGSFNLADYIQPPTGAAKPAERKLQMIPTRKIFANDKNFYDTSKVDDLIDSILMQGLLDPLTVRPSGDGEGYIIISGHRRHRALMTILDDHLAEDTKLFETTPCFVREPGDELMEELRGQGVLDINTVKYAVLETSGHLSVLLRADQQPLTARQMAVAVEDDVSLPTLVINDGRVMAENLHLAGRDENWLRQQLQKRRIKHARDVFLLSVDENGTVVCQLKEDVR